MSLPKNINAYILEAQTLHSALLSGGGRYTMSSRKEAQKWRARAYMYRSLLRVDGHSPYELMTLAIDGNDIVITFAKENGTLVTGQPIPEDNLLALAKSFAEKLND